MSFSYILHMICESVYICSGMNLYTIIICTDSVNVGLCWCVLLAANGLVYYWMNAYYIVMYIYNVSVRILYRYECISVLIHVILYYCITTQDVIAKEKWNASKVHTLKHIQRKFTTIAKKQHHMLEEAKPNLPPIGTLLAEILNQRLRHMVG